MTRRDVSNAFAVVAVILACACGSDAHQAQNPSAPGVTTVPAAATSIAGISVLPPPGYHIVDEGVLAGGLPLVHQYALRNDKAAEPQEEFSVWVYAAGSQLANTFATSSLADALNTLVPARKKGDGVIQMNGTRTINGLEAGELRSYGGNELLQELYIPRPDGRLFQLFGSAETTRISEKDQMERFAAITAGLRPG
jgi:hypothetical protein